MALPRASNRVAQNVMTGKKIITTRYDVAEHLRTPKEQAAYFEACLEEADGDAAFIAKALKDIARAKSMMPSHAPPRVRPANHH